jgi:hypothetical protein
MTSTTRSPDVLYLPDIRPIETSLHPADLRRAVVIPTRSSERHCPRIRHQPARPNIPKAMG